MDVNEGVRETIETSGELIVLTDRIIRDLPPILAGTAPDQIEERVEQFFLSVARIFEAWVARRASTHTQRAYRQDVMAFIAFRQIAWPEDATDAFADLGRRRPRLARPPGRRRSRPQDPQSPRSRRSPASSNTSRPPPPSCGCRSPSPTRPMPSSSAATPPTPARKPGRSPPPGPASSWACPPATASSTTATGRS